MIYLILSNFYNMANTTFHLKEYIDTELLNNYVPYCKN